MRIKHILDRIVLHSATLESYASIYNVVEKVKPDECYRLAVQSFVSYFLRMSFSTINTNINEIHCILSAVKEKAPACRFYFAASSEMFGNARENPDRDHSFEPTFSLRHLEGCRLFI
jgi:GDPmannose 4,6-dehydratase